METVIVGNLTAEPELHFTPGGVPVLDLSVAVNRRRKDEEVTHFFDVTCLGDLAVNAADSLGKGCRVIVAGELVQEQWTGRDGAKRNKVKIRADALGPDLRWATASVEKATKK